MKLTDQNFEAEALEAKLPVFVYFSAVWCPPCRLAGPAVDELVKEFEDKVKIGKLNVDESPQTAQKYGVMSVPTVIIFKDGKEVKRQVGFSGKAGYESLLKEVI